MFSFLGAEFSAVMLHNRGMVEVSIDAIVTAATFLVAVVAMVTFMRSEQKRAAERHDQLRKDLTDEIRGLRQELVAQFAEHKREMHTLFAEHKHETHTLHTDHKNETATRFDSIDERLHIIENDVAHIKGSLGLPLLVVQK